MGIYFSTFISGTGDIVGELLKNKTSKVEIKLLLDGLIVFETSSSALEVKNLRFFNNSFILLREDKGSGVLKFAESVVSEKNLREKCKSVLSNQIKTFRVIYSKQNEISQIDKQTLQKLEALISRQLRLRVDRANPDIEFWILERSEGYNFFGVRITKKQDTKKTLEQGELRPELANILCELSEPKETDTFLDPFAGSGAIPIERARIGKFKKIFAGENNKATYQKLAEKIKTLKLNIVVGKWNATNLGALTDELIDKIVTDPPWGQYDKNIDAGELYRSFFDEVYRISKNGGIVILLTSQKELVDGIMERQGNRFVLEKKYNILVSGKKSGIFKFRKS